MSEHDRLVRAALAYAQRFGWPVFPLSPGTKVPLKDTRSFRDATTDPEIIRRWWACWPQANIGLACGAAGLVVVDLDVKGGADGIETWRELKARHGIDDETLASRTPSGGRHLFFRCPRDAIIGNSAGKLGPGVDVRGDGGYSVLPPSAVTGGEQPGRYGWEPGAGPGDREPAPLPRALAGLLAKEIGGGSPGSLPSRPGPGGNLSGATSPDGNGKPSDSAPGERPGMSQGGQGEAGGGAYARAARRSEVGALPGARKGERNDRLNRAAYSLGRFVSTGWLDRGEVESELARAALASGLGAGEIQATIQSGLSAGADRPVGDLPGQAGSFQDVSWKEGSPLGRPAQGPVLGAPETQRAPPPQPGRQVLDATAYDFEVPALPAYARLPEGAGREASPWLDDYVAYSRTWSPRSFQGFHEACALWLLSTVAARRVMVHFGQPRFTNLYLLLAGRTTMHAKSSATGIAREVLAACGLDYLLAPDESTPQSFVRSLAGGDLPAGYLALALEQQLAARLRLGFCGQVGLYMEEFGSWLQAMLRPDGIMADFRGLLRRLDDCPPTYTRSTIARGREEVLRPYLALIANLTPADLRPLAKRGAQLWGDGFLARMAFVTPPRDEVLTARFPQGQRTIPGKLLAPLSGWHQRLGLPRVEVRAGTEGDGDLVATIEPPAPQECDLSGEVWDALYRYNEGLLEIARGSELIDLDGNYGRLHEKALRVAALLASLENEGRIELRHWARAQAIAERWRLYTHRLYAQVTEPEVSPAAEIEDKILKALRRWQGTQKYPDGMTANEIRRFLSGLGRIEVAYYADQMVQAGVLVRQRSGRTQRYAIPAPERPIMEPEGQVQT